jgi:transglutaminase-like putative cysteine protease
MKLVRSFPAVAFATIVAGIVGFCVAAEDVLLLLVAGVVAGVSWYVTEGPRARFLPGWTANVLIIAAWLAALVEFARSLGGSQPELLRDDLLRALGRLLAWLALIKLYQRKSPRDYAQLLCLSAVLALLGCVLSSELLFGAVGLLCAGLALSAVPLYRIHASYELYRRERLAAVPPGSRLVPSLQPVFGRRVVGNFRTLNAALVAGSFAVASGLFVLFPRHLASSLETGLPGVVQRSSGFSDEVDLAGTTRITASRRVVFTVAMPGVPHREPWRLRGAVLDRHAGRGSWTRSASSPGSLESFLTVPQQFTPLGGAGEQDALTITQHVTVFAPQRTLFSMYVPVAISTPDQRSVRFDRASATLRDLGTGRLRRYAIRAQPQPDDRTLESLAAGAPAPMPPSAAGVDGRVAALARDLLLAAGLAPQPPDDPAQKFRHCTQAAAVLAAYLRGGGFTYDLDLSDLTVEGDPVVQFLFKTRRGHCEHFASALASMCLAVGVPARLVTGYLAAEYDQAAGHYVVRECNAHAWVETHAGARRWETFDPTPPEVLRDLHEGRRSLGGSLRRLADRLDAWWRTEVMGFDEEARTRLLERLGSGWAEAMADAAAAMLRWGARLNRAFYLGPAGYIWMGSVGMVVIVALVAAALHLRRLRRLKATLRVAPGPWGLRHRELVRLRYYLDMLEVMARGGFPKPAWQPPLAWAGSLRRVAPGPAAIVRELTALFYASRYGAREPSRGEDARAKDLVVRLRIALRSTR